MNKLKLTIMADLNSQNTKRIYTKPRLEKIQIDSEISLIMTTSETEPPDPGGDPGGGGIWG